MSITLTHNRKELNTFLDELYSADQSINYTFHVEENNELPWKAFETTFY